MNITITNDEGIPAYEIRAYNSECWEIWEYKQVEEKEKGRKTGRRGFKWVSAGKYPSTLSQAFLTVYERILKRTDIDLDGFEEVARIVLDTERRVRDAERAQ